MRKELAFGTLLAALISCGGGGGGGESGNVPVPPEGGNEDTGVSQPVKSFGELLREKLSDPTVRSRIEDVPDSTRNLPPQGKLEGKQNFGYFGLYPNGWYASGQKGSQGNFKDYTGTITANDATTEVLSPDSSGNSLHLIALDSSGNSKFMYSPACAKNTLTQTFTCSSVQVWDGSSWVDRSGLITLGVDLYPPVVTFPDGTYGWAVKKGGRGRNIFLDPSGKWGIIDDFDINAQYFTEGTVDVFLLWDGYIEGNDICFTVYMLNRSDNRSYDKKAIMCF